MKLSLVKLKQHFSYNYNFIDTPLPLIILPNIKFLFLSGLSLSMILSSKCQQLVFKFDYFGHIKPILLEYVRRTRRKRNEKARY